MTWLLSDFISYPHPHITLISTQICCYSSNKHAKIIPITGLSKHKLHRTKLNRQGRQCSSFLQQRREARTVLTSLKQSTIGFLKAGVRKRPQAICVCDWLCPKKSKLFTYSQEENLTQSCNCASTNKEKKTKL